MTLDVLEVEIRQAGFGHRRELQQRGWDVCKDTLGGYNETT